MSETKEPCEVEQIREKNTTKVNKVETSVREEEQGTLIDPCGFKYIRKVLQWTIGTCKHSDWNEMYKEQQGSITTTLRLDMEGKEYKLCQMKALGWDSG